ncbi:MAG: HepT-like ribonuclease domain-containing protein [Pseudonocardia sp.]
MIDVDAGHGYFDTAGFALEIEELLGVFTQVGTVGGLKLRLRDRVLAEAVTVCGVILSDSRTSPRQPTRSGPGGAWSGGVRRRGGSADRPGASCPGDRRAASRVSEELRDRYPVVPWRQIVGIRNRVVHSYFEVDLDILWFVVSVNVPDLAPKGTSGELPTPHRRCR